MKLENHIQQISQDFTKQLQLQWMEIRICNAIIYSVLHNSARKNLSFSFRLLNS